MEEPESETDDYGAWVSEFGVGLEVAGEAAKSPLPSLRSLL
jgi:hypothetical protein